MQKQSFQKNLYYLTVNWRNKKVHAFLKGIRPKVNEIVGLDFKLAYFDDTVQHFNRYDTVIPHPKEVWSSKFFYPSLYQFDTFDKQQSKKLYNCLVKQTCF